MQSKRSWKANTTSIEYIPLSRLRKQSVKREIRLTNQGVCIKGARGAVNNEGTWLCQPFNLKLYRFDDMGGWLARDINVHNEILGESPKIGGKPSRPRRD